MRKRKEWGIAEVLTMNSMKGAQKAGVWSVLDHGYVKLIDYMGTDETIVEAARMSTNKGFLGWDPHLRCKVCGVVKLVGAPTLCMMEHEEFTGREHEWEQIPGDKNLLETLWSEGHTSPFEMCELHLEVQVPLLVARQWHRHRTQSYNELSGRYTQMPEIHYLPAVGRIQKQSKSNKQGSAEVLDPAEAKKIIEQFGDEQDGIYDNYEKLIEGGVANELARLNTPLSRYTRFRAKTDLLNWFRFLDKRMRPGAQWETQQYANVIGYSIVADLWPRAWRLFQEYTLDSTTFSRTEMELLKAFLKGTDIQALGRQAYAHGLSERKSAKFMSKLDLTVGKDKA